MIKNNLSKLLGEKRWTQKKLSELTGIRPNTINELYHSFAERVSFEHMNKICEALDCELADLFEYIPDNTPVTGKSLIIEEHGNRKKKIEDN